MNKSLALKDVVSKGTFPRSKITNPSELRLLGLVKCEWFSQRVVAQCRDTCHQYTCLSGHIGPRPCQRTGPKSLMAVVFTDGPVTDTRAAFVSKPGDLLFKDLLSHTGSSPKRARSRIKMTNLDFGSSHSYTSQRQ